MAFGRLGNALGFKRKKELLEATPEDTQKWLRKIAKEASYFTEHPIELAAGLQNNPEVQLLCSALGKRAYKTPFTDDSLWRRNQHGDLAINMLSVLQREDMRNVGSWLVRTIHMSQADLSYTVLANHSRLALYPLEQLELVT